MTYEELVDEIGSKLTALERSEDVPRFAKVFTKPFNARVTPVKNFPIAIVVEESDENDYLDNQSNQDTYVYAVHLARLEKNSTMEKEWGELRKDVDAVKTAFNTDWTLGDAVVNIAPAGARWGVADYDAGGILLTCVVYLRCLVVEPLT